jgi:hypothetical protein
MSKRYAARIGQSAVPYRIVIRGTIEPPLLGPLSEMNIETSGTESALIGGIVDQAQLQGVLMWLSDLGIEIVSVNPVPEDDR